MLKTLLAATAALTLMSGVGFAQSTYSSSTTESTTAMPAPSHVDVSTTTRHSIDSDGMTTEKDKTVTSGSDLSATGNVMTHKKTETTTVR